MTALPPSALSAAIGRRVRDNRQARGWTLDELAAAAAVSRRTVIQVEQGEANPSVGTLLKLGDALGVGLPALVEPVQARQVTLTRAGEGPVLWSGEHGGQGVLVAATGAPDVVELWEWTLEPGDAHVSDAHTHGTKELLQVRQGSVVVTSAGHSATLQAGDAASFDGDAEHSYANGGAGRAQFTLAVFEPRGRTAATRG